MTIYQINKLGFSLGPMTSTAVDIRHGFSIWNQLFTPIIFIPALNQWSSYGADWCCSARLLMVSLSAAWTVPSSIMKVTNSLEVFWSIPDWFLCVLNPCNIFHNGILLCSNGEQPIKKNGNSLYSFGYLCVIPYKYLVVYPMFGSEIFT